jgi:protocatechuate 3,4-dioxygenase beta subunit
VIRYRSRSAADHPPALFPAYRSTVKRSPALEPIRVPQTISEITGPGPAFSAIAEESPDLTTNAGTGSPALGQRSIVTGRVVDENGNGVGGTLVEIWQADASGRYAHPRETEFAAPRDPNFVGQGACKTDADGVYRFTTIKPGPYPWGNHPNAWRPAHIHFSILGPALVTRLVTQMYFPDDPLLALDPIFLSVPEIARKRLIAAYDHAVTRERWALGYRFDIVVAGIEQTPTEEPGTWRR